MKRVLFQGLCLLVFSSIFSCHAKKESTEEGEKKLTALIIDGENNHGIWPKTTMMMKSYLEETGLFEVDISRKKYTWQGPHHAVKNMEITELLSLYAHPTFKTETVENPLMDSTFSPVFSNYDVVISNLGWKASEWPSSTKRKFEDYMKNGGGLVVVHAANNSFGDWEEYNRMIGIGGWGGRNTASGPYVYYNDKNELIRDTTTGLCGSHGPEHEFIITTRESNHPIMKDLPDSFLHVRDELYDRLRGPATQFTVLATAYSDEAKNGPPWNKEIKGSGRHEPILAVIDYGRGRIFHSTLGHMDYSMECVGFITTFQRGCEWAASGKVTQSIPNDYPDREQISTRTWK